MSAGNEPNTPPPLPPTGVNLEDDYCPMRKRIGIVTTVEALLKHPRQVIFQLHQEHPAWLIACLCAIAIICSLAYGFVVGSFSGGQQLWIASAKVPAALLISALFCLPSLYIFTCLNGIEVRLAEVCGLLFGAVALCCVLLVGFAPIAWLFSESTHSEAFIGALHLLFWGIGICFGLRLLFDGLTYLNANEAGHLNVWAFLFILVCLQMTTTLRPIVGTADTFLPTEKKFFLVHWWNC